MTTAARIVSRTCSRCGATYEGAAMFCPVDGTRLSGDRWTDGGVDAGG